MQNLIFSLNATLPVFLVMVVGYALGQLGFLPPAFCKASDRLTFKVTLPLMLFLDMGSKGKGQRKRKDERYDGTGKAEKRTGQFTAPGGGFNF